jgi:hypothetical protein
LRHLRQETANRQDWDIFFFANEIQHFLKTTQRRFAIPEENALVGIALLWMLRLAHARFRLQWSETQAF